MKKKFIISVILGGGILSVCAARPEKVQVKQVDVKSAIKNSVLETQSVNFLDVLKSELTATSFQKKSKLSNDFLKDQKQFLLEDRPGVLAHYGVKEKTLKSVYEILRQEANLPNRMRIENSEIRNIVFSKRKSGKIDSSKCTVRSAFEIRFETKDDFSDARYKVEVNWKVKNRFKSGEFLEVQKVDMESLNVKKMALLTSESKQILETAKGKVQKWCLDMPYNLESEQTEYASQAIDTLQSMNLRLTDISVEKENGLNFILSINQPIRFKIDPYQFIPDTAKDFYENPEAFLELTPLFKVVVDSVDYSKGVLTTVSMVPSVIKPKRTSFSKKEVSMIGSEAEAYVGQFLLRLNEYVQNKTGLSGLMDFFEDENVVVEVSYAGEEGVRIDKRKVKDYLNRIDAKEFKTNLLNVGGDSKTMVVRFSQKFIGATYSDYTEKEVLLELKDSGLVVTRINVVPNTTVKR